MTNMPTRRLGEATHFRCSDAPFLINGASLYGVCQGAWAAASGLSVRGKSGLHETRVAGNARPVRLSGRSRGKVPQRVYRRWPLKGTGKGERVRQERTGALATGSAWQTPPGARPNRGLPPKGRGVSPREARVGCLSHGVIHGLDEWLPLRGRSVLRIPRAGQNPAYMAPWQYLDALNPGPHCCNGNLRRAYHRVCRYCANPPSLAPSPVP